ncbi:MAG TPA: peptidoglycan DD-metalloendopeptidase family protein, partial [Beijerinckiaceae bacterium]|nr:peptidoglycan DD-metalloendopeptidase family protein [Beijerinckiaceae bacterium]
MRKLGGVDRLQLLSRIGAIGLIGGMAAACSADTSRLAGNPFSNPFGSGAEPAMTGSLADKPVARAPTTAVQAQPLPAPQMTPRSAAAPVYNQPSASAPVAVASTPRPAPVTQTGPGGWTADGGTPITIGAGEGLAVIATRYGVPERAILSANGLSNASQVTVGRQIVIPIYNAGAQAQAATPAPIKAAPVAQTPRAAGQPKLQFVEGPKPAVKAEPKPAVNAEPKPAVKAEPKPEAKADPKKHPRPGQTSAQVAKVDAKVAAKPETKTHVRPGQLTALKPAVAKVETAQKPAAPQKPEKVARVEAQPVKPVETVKPTPQKVAAQPKPEVVKPEPVKPAPVPVAPKQETAAAAPSSPAKEPAETGAVPQNPSADFRWPARGRVIAGYSGGGGNEGINIAVPEGTPVKAAEGGTVAYAGSEVKGYGNLVLIKHDNGYVSAYAHNGELNVKRGEKVKRGQVVAKSGQSGNVTSPQLHFEIRKGSTPVDPVPYLSN